MRKISFVVFVVFITITGIGCNNHLLSLPTFGGNSSNSTMGAETQFGAPANLVATQGGYREITLTWSPVSDAVRYYVYRANTQFETFVQIGETADASTSYTMKVPTGSDYYYRITAVDYSGKQSSFSSIQRGTSLAQPIISAIEGVEGQEDSSITVYWYMGNVDAYQNNVRYNVICSDAKGTELARVVVDGSKETKTEAVITGLTPNTDYQYKVEAYLVSEQDKVEGANPIDAATARRLRPNAPEELVIEQGRSTSEIKISFELPDLVDIALPGGIYEQVPLYFKIYRRVYDENNTDVEKGWELVKADLGKTNTVPVENEMQKVDFGSGDIDYTPETLVTWTDTNKLKRGEKYEYKVQSFAYTDRDITSKFSYTLGTGWVIAPATFGTGLYETTLNLGKTANDSATLKFNFKWDTMGLDDAYSFALTETRWTLESDEVDNTSKQKETNTKNFTSLQEINEYVRTFEGLDSKDVRGYYQYKLAILTQDGTEVLALDSLGRAIVTDQINIPVIKLFSATSGYNDRIELQWKYNPDYTYTLSYSTGDGAAAQTIDHDTLYASYKEGEEISLQEGATVTYTHTVDPGTKYEYKLTVADEIDVDSLPIVAYSSKKPDLVAENPAYDSITISWEDVPATSFEISAKYDDETIASANSIETQRQEGNSEDSLSEVPRTATFSQPSGYNDATISGKPLTVTVNADIPVTRTIHELAGETGSSYEITTETLDPIKLTSTISTATMGPALINAKPSLGTHSDKITLTWDKVKGATAYIILRNSLHISANSSGNDLLTEFQNTDTYLVTDVDTTPKVTLLPNNHTDEHFSVVATENSFTFTDTLMVDKLEDETLGKWHRSQSQLSWGAPYEYIVLPLLTSADEVVYDYTTAPAAATVDTVALTNVQHPAGATKGYAWNVKATKGTYSETNKETGEKENTGVKLTWTRPWAMPTTAYSVYRAEVKEGDLTWEKLGLGAQSNETETVDKTAVPGKMYWYMVAPSVTEDKFSPYENEKYVSFNSGIMDESHKEERLANGFMLPQIEFKATREKKNYTHELGGKIGLEWIAPVTAGKTNYLFEGYKIELLNNNISADWQEYETIAFKGETGKEPSYTRLADNSSGKLKVLRDYKMYFRIRTYTTDENGDRVYSKEPEFTWNNSTGTATHDKYIVWGARQLTPDEHIKAATLAMSVGLERAKSQRNGAGSNDQWSSAHGVGINNESSPGSGSSSLNSFKDRYKILGIPVGDVYHQIKFNDYKPSLTTKSGRNVSFLTIQASSDDNALYGDTWDGTAIRAATDYSTKGKYDNHEEPQFITILGPDDTNGMYDGQILFYRYNPHLENGGGYLRLYPGLDESDNGSNYYTRNSGTNITPFPSKDNGSVFNNDTGDWQ